MSETLEPIYGASTCTRCGGFDDTDSGLCRACWYEDWPPDYDMPDIDLSEEVLP